MSTNRPIELRAGAAAATIDPERGGRLASLSIGGRELLVGPSSPPDATISWGSFLMAPWPGRLAEGRLRWRGGTIQLPRTHGRHAIHGLVSGVPWRVDGAGAGAASLSVALEPLGWPFAGTVRQGFELTPSGLRMTASIEAGQAMPAALGWHPWFLRRGPGQVHVKLAATATLQTRGMIPTGRSLALGRRTDLRTGPALGARRLDDAYVGVTSPAVLRWPDLELRLEFENAVAVVVHTRADRFCVEPQTAWPNALGLEGEDASRAGRRILEPGDTLRAELRLSWNDRAVG